MLYVSDIPIPFCFNKDTSGFELVSDVICFKHFHFLSVSTRTLVVLSLSVMLYVSDIPVTLSVMLYVSNISSFFLFQQGL